LVSHIGAGNLTNYIQGVFSISAQLPEENLVEVEKIILEHLRRLQQEPISELELKRIRTLVANRFIFGNERPSDRANLYGYYQSFLGDLEPALNYPASIQALDSASLTETAKSYLSPDAYAVVIIRPKQK
jgi:predicted Zn-dependent peptidase